jgi:hypothetical protein
VHWILIGSNFNHATERRTGHRKFKYVSGEVTLHGSETAVPFVDANQFLLNQRLSKIWLMPAFNGICDVKAVNTFIPLLNQTRVKANRPLYSRAGKAKPTNSQG